MTRLPGARWLLAPACVRTARRLASLDGVQAALVDHRAADPPYPRRSRLAPLAEPGAPACPVAAWLGGYGALALALVLPGELDARQAARVATHTLDLDLRAADVARAPSRYTGDPLAVPPASPVASPGEPTHARPWRVVFYFDRLAIPG